MLFSSSTSVFDLKLLFLEFYLRYENFVCIFLHLPIPILSRALISLAYSMKERTTFAYHPLPNTRQSHSRFDVRLSLVITFFNEDNTRLRSITNSFYAIGPSDVPSMDMIDTLSVELFTLVSFCFLKPMKLRTENEIRHGLCLYFETFIISLMESM